MQTPPCSASLAAYSSTDIPYFHLRLFLRLAARRFGFVAYLPRRRTLMASLFSRQCVRLVAQSFPEFAILCVSLSFACILAALLLRHGIIHGAPSCIRFGVIACRDVATFVSHAGFARRDMVWFVRSVRPKRSRRLVAKGEDGQPIRVLVSEPRARGGARRRFRMGAQVRDPCMQPGNRMEAQGRRSDDYLTVTDSCYRGQ